MSNHFPHDHALGLLALELAGGDAPQHAALDTAAAGALAATAVDVSLLRRPFGIYLLLAAASLLLQTKKRGKA